MDSGEDFLTPAPRAGQASPRTLPNGDFGLAQKGPQKGPEMEPISGPNEPKTKPFRGPKTFKTLCFPCVSAENGPPKGPPKWARNEAKWGRKWARIGSNLGRKVVEIHQNRILFLWSPKRGLGNFRKSSRKFFSKMSRNRGLETF